jgi:hypothetical protein
MATPENIGSYVTTGDDGVEKYIVTFAINKADADADVSTYDPASPTSPGVTIARTWCRPIFDSLKPPGG